MSRTRYKMRNNIYVICTMNKRVFKNQIKGLSNSLDIKMSGSDNYTTSIGIQNLSQPLENPISASLFILLIVLGILGILCLFCLVFKFVGKVFPHSTRYVFRVVKYNKNHCQHLKTFFMSTWWGVQGNLLKVIVIWTVKR